MSFGLFWNIPSACSLQQTKWLWFLSYVSCGSSCLHACLQKADVGMWWQLMGCWATGTGPLESSLISSPTISSEVGALSKGKLDNDHAKHKPGAPLRPTSLICLSLASLLPVTPPLPTLKGPWYCFLLAHSENKYFSLGTQWDLQGMVSGECLTAAASHRLSSCWVACPWHCWHLGPCCSLLWGCVVHCRVFSSIPGFYTLDARSMKTLSQHCDNENVSRHSQYLLGAKLPLFKNHCAKEKTWGDPNLQSPLDTGVND